MTLAAAVAHTLPTLRAEAEAMMADSVALLVETRTFDKASMKWVITEQPGSAVPAKFMRQQAAGLDPRMIGEAEVPVANPVLCTPISAPRWSVGSRLKVLSGVRAGQVLTITHTADPSHAVQHKYVVEVVQS